MGEWKERIKRLLFEENVYSIGIRRRKDKLLIDGNTQDPFWILPISKDEWYADPIVFSRQGKDYLFCEVYDRKTDKGKIGVTLLVSDSPQKPEVCFEIDSHLSYPMVFEKDGTIFMIPETTTRKTVMLYKAVDFPMKWELVKELISGDEFSDTTVFREGNQTILLTFEQFEGNGSIVRLNVFNAEHITDGELQVIINSNDNFSNQIRGGGSLFYHDGKLIRPAQDCSKVYGYALNFFQVERLTPIYEEKLIAKIEPGNLKTNLEKEIIGIHTYGLTNSYEFIDVKFNDIIISHQIRRLWRFGINEITKLFKY